MRILAYILVAISILLLSKELLPRFHGSHNSPIAAANTQIGSITTALNCFKVDTGRYPLQLKELLEHPSEVTNWRGPYLDKIAGVPNDSWGNAFLYHYPGKHNGGLFDLCSAGPDGHLGTADDLTNWQPEK